MLRENYEGSIRSIAKKIGFSPMQTRKELENLEAIGIVKNKRIGNSKIYSIDEKCNFLDEFRRLITKLTGFEGRIKEILKIIDGIESAFIYGSYASGNFKGKSDIDLFIIGNLNMEKLNSKIFKLQREIEKEINYVVYPRKEFEKKKNSGFVRNVLQERKIILIGDRNELE